MEKTKESFWIYFAEYLPTGKIILFGTSYAQVNKAVWGWYAGMFGMENYSITGVEQPL